MLSDRISIPATPPVPYHLLTSNIPPTTLERNLILYDVVQARITMNSISTELERLKFAQDKLQQFLDQYEGAVSLLRSFPNEILAEIMIHSIPPFKIDNKWSSQRAAVTLASVCSQWRATAISTPRLWTIIEWGKSKGQIALMELSLSRSGQCGFELHTGDIRPGRDDYHITAMEPHSHRMTRFEGYAYTSIIIFSPLPRLRSIEIGVSMTDNDFMSLLIVCPSLEEATIWLNDDRRDLVLTSRSDPYKSRSLVLSHMRALRIRYMTPLGPLLKRIATPVLTEFYAMTHDPYEPTFWPHRAFMDYMKRSKPSLIKIGLSPSAMEMQNIQEIFDYAPNLEELDISWSFITTEICELLTKEIRLPHLSTLRIEEDLDMQMDPKTFVEIISARMASLQKLVLIIPRKSNRQIIASFPKERHFGSFLRFMQDSSCILEVQNSDRVVLKLDPLK